MTEKCGYKIELSLFKFKKAIAVQILNMNEDFRCVDNIVHYLDGPINIKSYNSPALRQDTVYLRGRIKALDLAVVTLLFKSDKERDDYVERLFESLAMWSKNWKPARPQPAKKVNTKTLDNVYCF